ncbi:MAG: NADPH:quinone oxidoreductase family protein [Pseudomonadota bacterium]
MKSLTVAAFDRVRIVNDATRPKPKSGEILVKVEACALNFADALMIAGRYQDTPPLPFTPGLEFAGRVEAIGADVTAPVPGTRVAAFAGAGGLAEYAVVPADRTIPIPEDMPWEIAAGFLVAYGTSHLALARRARLVRDETLVVLGAAGGVGLTAVEIGRVMGARVIGVARGASRGQTVRDAGADLVLDPTNCDLRTTLKAEGGADVLYDPVGGEAFDAAFRAMRPEGRILVIGFASGRVPEPKLNHLMVKNIDLIGVNWGAYGRIRPAAMRSSLATLLEWWDTGRLCPTPPEILPFDRAPEGIERLGARQVTGKIVIRMTDAP